MKTATFTRRANRPRVKELICAATAAIALFGASAEATNTSSTAAILKASPKPTYVAGKGAARFNWLAPEPADTEKSRQTARREPVANGSYVCSPAGFGRKSSCYAR